MEIRESLALFGLGLHQQHRNEQPNRKENKPESKREWRVQAFEPTAAQAPNPIGLFPHAIPLPAQVGSERLRRPGGRPARVGGGVRQVSESFPRIIEKEFGVIFKPSGPRAAELSDQRNVACCACS